MNVCFCCILLTGCIVSKKLDVALEFLQEQLSSFAAYALTWNLSLIVRINCDWLSSPF